MHNTQRPIDPMFGKPDDGISGIVELDPNRVDNLHRLTAHSSAPERKGVNRKGLVAVIAMTGLALASYGIGRIAPDGGEPPHPGNMEEFSNDPLQDEYNANPEGFTVRGGSIVPLDQDQP